MMLQILIRNLRGALLFCLARSAFLSFLDSTQSGLRRKERATQHGTHQEHTQRG